MLKLAQVESGLLPEWFTLETAPPAFKLAGRLYLRSTGLARPGVLMHYRERAHPWSRHLYVKRAGRQLGWVIDHIDQANPSAAPLAHYFLDVL